MAAACLKANIKQTTGANYVQQVRPLLTSLLPDNMQQNRRGAAKITHLTVEGSKKKEEVPKVDRRKKLLEVHSRFLADFFENFESATLNDAVVALQNEFPGFTISVSGLHNHLKKKCCLVVKSLGASSSKKFETTSLPRDLDVAEDCVFVGATDLLIYLRRSFGWVAEPVSVVHGGVMIPTMVAICKSGIVETSIGSPYAVIQKETTGKEEKRQATKMDFFLKFISSTTDVMKKTNLKQKYLVVNNEDIYNDLWTQEYLKDMNVKMLLWDNLDFGFFWWQLKSKINRNDLEEGNQLVPRLVEGAKQFTSDECRDCIEKIARLTK